MIPSIWALFHHSPFLFFNCVISEEEDLHPRSRVCFQVFWATNSKCFPSIQVRQLLFLEEPSLQILRIFVVYWLLQAYTFLCLESIL